MKKFFRFFLKTFSIIPRIVLGILFWALFILFIVGLFYNPTPKPKDGELLYLSPYGLVVDEYSTSDMQREWSRYMGIEPIETLLPDIRESLERAALDIRIPGVVLDLRNMSGAGTAVLEEFRRDLINFKKSGKPLFVYGRFINQSDLFLSSIADETFMDPMGDVFIRGYGIYRSYFKKGLDKWGINAHVYRAGENKSYVETMLNSSMSRKEKNAASSYIDDLWQNWLSEVSLALDRETGEIQSYSDNYGTLLSRSRLSASELALEKGLVSKLLTYDQFVQEMITRFGLDESGRSFKQINWYDYLSHTDKLKINSLEGPQVALLNLSGSIYWGDGDWGSIGSSSVGEILEMIYSNHRIAALVVRIDSPGGSAMGAEDIRRKLEKFHNYGIPLIISMGNTAASGGYWIACEGDEIFAENTTLTGSIGVFSYFFTYEEALKEHLGIEVDGFGTSALSDSYRMDREPGKETELMIQAGVDQTYNQFLSLVSEKRQISQKELSSLSGGLVWTGRQAKENGLVDSIGGLEAALDRAAQIAMLGEDYSVIQFDDNLYSSHLFPGGLGKIFLRGISSLNISITERIFTKLNFPDNKLISEEIFGDPRSLNAWSPYEIIQ
jgi:protease-4